MDFGMVIKNKNFLLFGFFYLDLLHFCDEFLKILNLNNFLFRFQRTWKKLLYDWFES